MSEFRAVQQTDTKKINLSFRAGGKPSTWFPPGRLVEHIFFRPKKILEKNKKKSNCAKTDKKNEKNAKITFFFIQKKNY